MLGTQDIERIMNRLDKIEEGQKEILKWTAKIDQLTIDHGRRITSLENKFWWFIGLWVAGAVGLFFYTFNGG